MLHRRLSAGLNWLPSTSVPNGPCYFAVASTGFDNYVFPASTSAAEIRDFSPDAALSNGPGDPAAVGICPRDSQILTEDYPTFGICLGHQIITHEAKCPDLVKFHGGELAGQELRRKRLHYSQNHGFASTLEELERVGAIVTEINLNDDTVEGLR